MAQHLSTETWTIIKGKRSLLHIETSMDCEIAGRHICSVNKNEDRVANLIMLSPELLALAYGVIEGLSRLELEEKAQSIIKRSTLPIL